MRGNVGKRGQGNVGKMGRFLVELPLLQGRTTSGMIARNMWVILIMIPQYEISILKTSKIYLEHLFSFLATLFRFMTCFTRVGILNSRPGGSHEVLVCVSESGFHVSDVNSESISIVDACCNYFPCSVFPSVSTFF